MSETILLNQSQVKELTTMKEIIENVETAYEFHAERKVQMPPKEYIFYKKFRGDLRIMPCFVRGLNESGVKNVNVHPDNPRKHNLPTVMAMIELVDPKTGFPVSVMDGTWITDMRTGAAAGVATKYLARDNSEILGLVGAGVQAATGLEAIMEVMDIKEVRVSCRTCQTRESFAQKASEKYGIPVKAVDTIKEAVQGADVLLTTTPAREPVVKSKWVSPGTHINAMGADAPGKQELDSHILQKSKIIIDCWDQASHSGEINIPVQEGIVRQRDIHGKIGDVIIGSIPGRTSDEEITVFDSTGLAVQDIVTAWNVYEKALQKGIGQKMNFLE
ncbi:MULTISPECIES: alanine dehydrogenase [Methanobacterium]|uniref:Alanine dehydrogenase n=1 Tax=Methanobacterium veterum TaxID=408577 RepID=A0A9E4ZUB3_9EURY|nr:MULTISPECIES: alanine dehydrogenase [Methanobacterium]MCZ3365782.1 alanine dehydrogenase [Methanobacterium veterum]MCZ3371246.1 alanine dehydrogenase [Methanobacterium veterum]